MHKIQTEVCMRSTIRHVFLKAESYKMLSNVLAITVGYTGIVFVHDITCTYIVTRDPSFLYVQPFHLYTVHTVCFLYMYLCLCSVVEMLSIKICHSSVYAFA